MLGKLDNYLLSCLNDHEMMGCFYLIFLNLLHLENYCSVILYTCRPATTTALTELFTQSIFKPAGIIIVVYLFPLLACWVGNSFTNIFFHSKKIARVQHQKSGKSKPVKVSDFTIIPPGKAFRSALDDL